MSNKKFQYSSLKELDEVAKKFVIRFVEDWERILKVLVEVHEAGKKHNKEGRLEDAYICMKKYCLLREYSKNYYKKEFNEKNDKEAEKLRKSLRDKLTKRYEEQRRNFSKECDELMKKNPNMQIFFADSSQKKPIENPSATRDALSSTHNPNTPPPPITPRSPEMPVDVAAGEGEVYTSYVAGQSQSDYQEIDPLFRAKKLQWYHPKITKEETETILKDQPPGSYLLRDSSIKDNFTLSVRVEGEVTHVRIRNEDDMVCEVEEQLENIKLKHPNFKTTPVQYQVIYSTKLDNPPKGSGGASQEKAPSYESMHELDLDRDAMQQTFGYISETLSSSFEIGEPEPQITNTRKIDGSCQHLEFTPVGNYEVDSDPQNQFSKVTECQHIEDAISQFFDKYKTPMTPLRKSVSASH
uniref:SH2 domain-containing protein n=1 Tax=Clytia hemisphaerica TaxID=252671 RepID=A0A7M5WIV9_9CNID